METLFSKRLGFYLPRHSQVLWSVYLFTSTVYRTVVLSADALSTLGYKAASKCILIHK